MNQRKDFRVKMYGAECVIFDKGTSTIGELFNLSGTGAALDLGYDYFKEKVSIEFEVGNKFFKRDGIIKYKEIMENGKVRYRLEFINFAERERVELHSALITYAAVN